MAYLLETLSTEWALRALLACSMVGIMCGIIGCFIVLRNMSLIGDALAHAILPGIFVAFILWGYNTLGFFVGSVSAGLLSSFGITWIQHNVKTKNDAAIGIVFTAMFSLGVIGISWLNNEQGAHLDLKDFLFGNVLGVSNEDLILTFFVMLYTIISVFLFYRYLFITTFQPIIAETMGISVKVIHYFLMLLLSFAVVSALRTVGVILVVAMLITPASTALLLSDKLKKVIQLSALIGMLSAVLGLIFAILAETPPGPAMVIVATAIYLFTAVFAPKKGLLIRHYRNRKQVIKIEREDILRQAIRQKRGRDLNLEAIREALGYSIKKLNKHLKFLAKNDLISLEGSTKLTVKGRAKADDLVRAHRLWESYQVQTMGLKEEQIHDEADRFEHFLTEDILDEVDKNLGFPDTDPHGSPIPRRNVLSGQSLLALKPNVRAIISAKQMNASIESDLWELGILPNTEFYVTHVGKENLVIKKDENEISIPLSLAGKIKVDGE